jgi:hypothetical protein
MNNKFTKYCQSCGGIQSYTTKSERNRAARNNTLCRSCHNKAGKSNKGKYREIPISWFEEKKRRSVQRDKEWDITIEYIWTIYLRQGKVCALSGLPLDFDKDSDQGMVSIDRINNDKGYVKRNVQLLHKDVNFAKWTFPQKYFIKLCKLIAEKHNVERE